MKVCVFCGSSPGRGSAYVEAARALGRALAGRGVGLVYGGASVGLMKELADAALEAGGEVVGVIPEVLRERELEHRGLTALHVVDGMGARKARMVELSDAFLALPGGHGTLDELFEVLTALQIGALRGKPVGLWNVGGYWTPLLTLMDHMEREGFTRPIDRARLIDAAELEPLLDQLLT